MSTRTYTSLNSKHPVISNNKIATENWARDNLVNIRDFLAITGFMPEWNMQLEGTDHSQPTGCLYSKGVEVIKITFTWGANNYPSKAYFYYSGDSGLNFVPLTDRKGNYVVTCSYDASENCTSEVWGTS